MCRHRRSFRGFGAIRLISLGLDPIACVFEGDKRLKMGSGLSLVIVRFDTDIPSLCFLISSFECSLGARGDVYVSILK